MARELGMEPTTTSVMWIWLPRPWYTSRGRGEVGGGVGDGEASLVGGRDVGRVRKCTGGGMFPGGGEFPVVDGLGEGRGLGMGWGTMVDGM